MGNPITWRTIMGPSPAEAAVPLEYARQAMNVGLGGLNTALTNYQKQQGEIFNEGKAANTQAFYDAIRTQFKSPEEYQAALNSGALDNMRSQYGNQIDTANTSKFLEGRLGDLRTIQEQENMYKKSITDKANAPILDAINAAYIKGDFAKGDALVAANPALGRQAELAKTKLSAEADLRARTQDIANYNFNEKNRSLIEDTKVNQLKAGNVTAQEQLNAINQNVVANKIVEDINKEFSANKAAVQQGIKNLSSRADFASYPKDQFGNVAVDRLNEEQAVRWGGAIQEAKLDKALDTSYAIRTAEDRLRASGISVERAQKALEVLNSAVTNKPTLSKEAQAEYDAQRSAITANKEKHKETNLFYYDPKKYNDEVSGVLSKLDREIKDSEGTKSRIKSTINKWTTEGIEYKDPVTGASVKQLVPPNLLNAAYEATKTLDEWKILENTTDKDMEKYIKNVMASKEYVDMRKEAAVYTSGQDKLALRKLRETYSPKSGVTNPVEYIEQAISKRRENAPTEEKLKAKLMLEQQKLTDKRLNDLGNLTMSNQSEVKLPTWKDVLKY